MDKGLREKGRGEERERGRACPGNSYSLRLSLFSRRLSPAAQIKWPRRRFEVGSLLWEASNLFRSRDANNGGHVRWLWRARRVNSRRQNADGGFTSGSTLFSLRHDESRASHFATQGNSCNLTFTRCYVFSLLTRLPDAFGTARASGSDVSGFHTLKLFNSTQTDWTNC